MCLESGKSKGSFQLNVKNLNTRPHEIFVVTPARTVRLARSMLNNGKKLVNFKKVTFFKMKVNPLSLVSHPLRSDHRVD